MGDMWGWLREGDNWYVYFVGGELDLTQAASAVASYRLTGQTRTIVPTITNWAGWPTPVLHIVVGQQALPNGTEVEFWLNITMNDASVVRYPTSGSIIVKVTR